MKTTKQTILELAEEYLNDKDYHRGIILKPWIDRVTEELNLKKLSDMELSNMWDMVHLTLDVQYYRNRLNGEFEKSMKYLDVQSAFTEVVNAEARRRRAKK